MTSILVCHVATCTYQEEPSWLDYPTVRHAKRWPSLDLVNDELDANERLENTLEALLPLCNAEDFQGFIGE